MKILFLGTASGAGKTTIAAMFCRHLHKMGIDVAPFKASNLSLNSFATASGGEIGMGQAFQAMACGIEPTTDMNPILLKPSKRGSMQIIIQGVANRDVSPGCYPDTDELMVSVKDSFYTIAKNHDAVVCEGSGSPVEVNIADRDLANIRLSREFDVPAIIVGDIERGGCFAAIYGTWRLVPDADKHRLAGFIINRFRGDPDVLRPGIERIESLTGMKCIGVMPYSDLRFPQEDSMTMGRGKLSGEDARSAYLRNLDEFLGSAKAHLDLDLLVEISKSGC